MQLLRLDLATSFFPLCTQVNTGVRLVRDVRNDLADVVEVCAAKKKQTNYLRSLISDLAKGNGGLVYSTWLFICLPKMRLPVN